MNDAELDAAVKQAGHALEGLLRPARFALVVVSAEGEVRCAANLLDVRKGLVERFIRDLEQERGR